VLGQPAQVLDRERPGVADPLLFIDLLALLAQEVAEPADNRGRLEADLASTYCTGDERKLPSCSPTRRRSAAEDAEMRQVESHPGIGRLALEQMVAAPYAFAHDATQKRLETVDGRAQLRGIDVLASLQPAHRSPQRFHIGIIRKLVRISQTIPVNLHSLQPTPSPLQHSSRFRNPAKNLTPDPHL
jgi:hypothetical protein